MERIWCGEPTLSDHFHVTLCKRLLMIVKNVSEIPEMTSQKPFWETNKWKFVFVRRQSCSFLGVASFWTHTGQWPSIKNDFSILPMDRLLCENFGKCSPSEKGDETVPTRDGTFLWLSLKFMMIGCVKVHRSYRSHEIP